MNKNATILLAEDTESIAKVTIRLLRSSGYNVIHAWNGQECIELAQKHSPDLIVLDLMMPVKDGLNALKELKLDIETSGIKVIICSAKGYKTEIDAALNHGALSFIEKPFKNEDLLGAIASCLSEQGSEANVQASIPSHETFLPKLSTGDFLFKLWGTRGSIPVSNASFLRYGGNTTCMHVQDEDNCIIFDAGSGIRDLGNYILSTKIRKLHIFITHTHWDHIQGFPFFTPLYIPGFEINIYAAQNLEKNLESIFRGQLDSAYFPVQLDDMQAKMNFINLKEQVKIGDFIVDWEYVMHPSPTVGYKITKNKKSLVFMPDNEFLKGYTGNPNEISQNDACILPHEKLIEFLRETNVIIHEAQYFPEEYPSKVGWGHTSISNAALLMKIVRPKKWILTHHDPMHNDDKLQQKFLLTEHLLKEINCDIPVVLAYDGMMGYL